MGTNEVGCCTNNNNIGACIKVIDLHFAQGMDTNKLPKVKAELFNGMTPLVDKRCFARKLKYPDITLYTVFDIV